MSTTRSEKQYRVFGFLLKEEALLKYALDNRLGTDDDRPAQIASIYRAAENFLDRYGVDRYIVAGVKMNGVFKTCAALASDDYEDRLPMPPKETIEKVQKMLGTTKPPRWFPRA
ncbi:hypothetical protein C8R47DRAFT_1190191 [Mycena vitilis]|nr:hypothetical protein C8R47DRAFT_1190191 [Mycena vitilis]